VELTENTPVNSPSTVAGLVAGLVADEIPLLGVFLSEHANNPNAVNAKINSFIFIILNPKYVSGTTVKWLIFNG
jgi:hypothetical protein